MSLVLCTSLIFVCLFGCLFVWVLVYFVGGGGVEQFHCVALAHSVEQTGLKMQRSPPDSASRVLGLKAYATIVQSSFSFLKTLFVIIVYGRVGPQATAHV